MAESFELETNEAVSADLTLASAKVRSSTESTEDKDFTYACTTMSNSNADKKSTCTKSKDGENVYGEYTVKSIEDSNSNSLTLTSATGNSFILVKPFEVAAEQEAKQTVDEATKTFTIKLSSGDYAPKFYSGNTETAKAFSSCSFSELTVTCTPTSEEIEKDKETKIYYKKPCESEFTETGVSVTYKGSSEGASSLTSLSKISLLIAGLFLF